MDRVVFSPYSVASLQAIGGHQNAVQETMILQCPHPEPGATWREIADSHILRGNEQLINTDEPHKR